MLKASALFIVTVMALVIGIASTSLITMAYFYRLEFQKGIRHSALLNNLESGTAVLLSKDFNKFDANVAIELPGNNAVTIMVRKERWGIYDLAFVQSYIQKDTITRAFLIGKNFDDYTALYLRDEDRPLSISGSTQIVGDAFLPGAGIRQSYAEGKSYSGGKILVRGIIKSSDITLPPLDAERISDIQQRLGNEKGVEWSVKDSLWNSFLNPVQVIRIPSNKASISKCSITGKFILICDTTVSISRTAIIENAIIFAPSIIIEDGFKGSCQFFASKSITTGKNVVLSYPSCMGIVNSSQSESQPEIILGGGSVFSGVLFTHKKDKSELETQITLGKNCIVSGEVYASGFLKMESPVMINGKASCNRFLVQTPTALYENQLIDVVLNRKKLSQYYLTSSLSSNKVADNKILKWLN
ncbi:MAG TPA: hypothetical protein VGB63_16330 [Pedobacter sp.]|jgi:hypothetical protein